MSCFFRHTIIDLSQQKYNKLVLPRRKRLLGRILLRECQVGSHIWKAIKGATLHMSAQRQKLLWPVLQMYLLLWIYSFSLLMFLTWKFTFQNSANETERDFLMYSTTKNLLRWCMFTHAPLSCSVSWKNKCYTCSKVNSEVMTVNAPE